MSGYVRIGQFISGYVRLCQGKSDYKLDQVNTGYVRLFHVR
jgi:hypothetical protein